MAGSDAPKLPNTFVFLDLETTGLGIYDCMITEISLLAVSQSALAEDSPWQPPRVVDKLVLCVDPGIDVSFGAAQITGLSRELLQRDNREIFSDKHAKFIKTFLEMQAPPVCLLAHNGNRFDFPILARHFREVEVEIPESLKILCACTLRAFQQLTPGAISRKLPDLYKRYVASDTSALHTAEGDSKALMQIVHRKGRDVLPWIEENATMFTHEFAAIKKSPVRAPRLRKMASAPGIPEDIEMPKMKKSRSMPISSQHF